MNRFESIRLNRLLAQLGVGSRRACDDLIESGKVWVDGARITTPGVKVVPGRQTITVDGVRLEPARRPIVLLLNKPTGVVSTVSDPQGRPTVLDFCKRYRKGRRLYPVGRLDINTTGALLITNDGVLCYRLTHPSFQVPKTYLVRVRGGFTDAKLRRLRRMAGVDAVARGRGSSHRPSVELVKHLDKITILEITLIEGRNRQVRRMCDAVGLRVVKLKRIRFGPVSIRELPLGSVRPLTDRELERLRKYAITGENDEH